MEHAVRGRWDHALVPQATSCDLSTVPPSSWAEQRRVVQGKKIKKSNGDGVRIKASSWTNRQQGAKFDVGCSLTSEGKDGPIIEVIICQKSMTFRVLCIKTMHT